LADTYRRKTDGIRPLSSAKAEPSSRRITATSSDLHGEDTFAGYPHRVWVSENPVNVNGDALVKKNIVTDEDESGQPVVHKVVNARPTGKL
jgi:hypothetical protein